MFDLNADWAAIVEGLGTDPGLVNRVKAHPGLRVPGCWNGFELATRAVLGQQISVKGATTLAAPTAPTFRPPVRCGHPPAPGFPTPAPRRNAPPARVALPPGRAHP